MNSLFSQWIFKLSVRCWCPISTDDIPFCLYNFTYQILIQSIKLYFHYKTVSDFNISYISQLMRSSTDENFTLYTAYSIHLVFVWLCITDINNTDNQLDATITVY
jgi:hypothetical protein